MFVRLGREYYCLEVFLLWARIRRRIFRFFGVVRFSIFVVIILRMFIKVMRLVKFTLYFLIKEVSFFLMVFFRNAIFLLVINSVFSFGLVKWGRMYLT